MALRATAAMGLGLPGERLHRALRYLAVTADRGPDRTNGDTQVVGQLHLGVAHSGTFRRLA